MSVPDYQTMMLAVLRLIAKGRRTVAECLPELQREFDISDEQASELIPSGKKTILADRAQWARTYMGKAGLVQSPRRGIHEITPRGLALLDEKPERIDKTTLARFPEFNEWMEASRQARSPKIQPPRASDELSEPEQHEARTSTQDETPEDRIRAAHAELEAALADELLQAVLQASPARFERLVVELLIAMGYGNGDASQGKAIGKSGDGGIDGIVNEDALGLDAVYIQAKRYAPGNTVGRPAIQSFVGSMSGESATKGVFVTTSTFSKDARDYLPKIAQRVVLIDGPRLARLMIAHGVGVRAQGAYVIRTLDSEFFDDA